MTTLVTAETDLALYFAGRKRSARTHCPFGLRRHSNASRYPARTSVRRGNGTQSVCKGRRSTLPLPLSVLTWAVSLGTNLVVVVVVVVAVVAVIAVTVVVVVIVMVVVVVVMAVVVVVVVVVMAVVVLVVMVMIVVVVVVVEGCYIGGVSDGGISE